MASKLALHEERQCAAADSPTAATRAAMPCRRRQNLSPFFSHFMFLSSSTAPSAKAYALGQKDAPIQARRVTSRVERSSLERARARAGLQTESAAVMRTA